MDLLDQPRNERVRRLAETEDPLLGKDHAIVRLWMIAQG